MAGTNGPRTGDFIGVVWPSSTELGPEGRVHLSPLSGGEQQTTAETPMLESPSEGPKVPTGGPKAESTSLEGQTPSGPAPVAPS